MFFGISPHWWILTVGRFCQFHCFMVTRDLTSLLSLLISGSVQPAKLGIIRGKRARPCIETDVLGTISGLWLCMYFCYGNDLQ